MPSFSPQMAGGKDKVKLGSFESRKPNIFRTDSSLVPRTQIPGKPIDQEEDTAETDWQPSTVRLAID